MRRSFKEIANFMDPLTPPQSLRALASLHRAADSPGTLAEGTVSFRQIVERHREPTEIRLLWYNTFLLHGVDISLACRGPGERRASPNYWEATFEAKPALTERANEIGARLARAEYDVIALCEIFDDSLRDRILGAWRSTEHEIQFEQGPPSHGPVHLPAGRFLDLLPLPPESADVTCPVPLTELTLTGTRANSGLLTIAIDRELSGTQARDYDASGDPLQDADFYSAKGVLKTTVELDIGQINLYSTHMNAGGGFPWSKDAKSNREERNRRRDIKETQVGEFVNFVGEVQEDEKEAVAVAVGDFNINGTPPDNQNYVRRLKQKMAEIDMEDLWILRSKDNAGNVTAGPTSVELSDEKGGERICDLADSDFLCNDLTPPMDDKSRIDYIFLQKQNPRHGIVVDVTRPRRVLFRRPDATENLAYMSDHLGMEVTLVINKR